VSLPRALLLAGVALLVLLHPLDGRDPRVHHVSELAFDFPVPTGVAFVLLGAGLAATGLAQARDRAAGALRRRLAAAALVLAGLALAALAAFPTDHEGRRPATTTVGEIHDRAAGVAILALLLGLLLAWSARRRTLAAVAVGAVVLVAPVLLVPEAFGLHQRAWFGALLAAALPLAPAAARDYPDGRGR
jgi:hypothetical protein